MKIRCSLLLVLALGAIAATAATATAAPSFFGYTGLVGVPTADALDKDDYNAAAFTLNFEEGADANVYCGNLGLADGLEVGFTRVRPDEGEGETYVNAKYRFSPETESRPAVAAGVVDFTDEVDTTVYVVLSKSMFGSYETQLGEVTGPRIHFGVGGGQFDGVFGGVSAVLGERLMLMVEHDSYEINFGARLALTSEVRVHFAGLDGLDDVGLGISFNKSF